MRITSVAAVFLIGVALGAQEPAMPRFAVAAPAQSAGNAVLVSLENGAVQVEEAGSRRTLERFIEIRQEGSVLPPLPSGHFALLTSGDRIPLDPEAAAQLQGSRLRIWPAKSMPAWNQTGLTLFAPHVVALFWAVPDAVDDADLFFAKLESERRKHDVVFLKNGDRLQGTLSEIGAKTGVVLNVDGRKTPTAWSQVAGIAWNTERQARLRSKKTHWHAVLRGGARLDFAEWSLSAKSRAWLGKTLFGASIELPLNDVLAVETRLGPAVDLAELAPVHYEQRPFLGVAWPLAKNTAVTGHALRLSDGTYEKGLGLHAPCRVAYQLDGAYQRFDGVVGLDELRSPRGKLRLAVELDGKRTELFEGKELTGRDPPVHVQLDARGARQLTLIVDLGSFGDVQAHVNWANARLIKKD